VACTFCIQHLRFLSLSFQRSYIYLSRFKCKNFSGFQAAQTNQIIARGRKVIIVRSRESMLIGVGPSGFGSPFSPIVNDEIKDTFHLSLSQSLLASICLTFDKQNDFKIVASVKWNAARKACKPISRDIYIDLSASFRFVFFFLFASLLLLHIHTHATNYLKNLLSHFVLSFVLLHSLRSFFSLFFFLVFLAGFFVQNKMASFWHWKKKYTLQRLSLSLNPRLPLPPLLC